MCSSVSGSKTLLSAFRLELLSIRWGPPSTEVLKFIHSFCSFQYQLEASGISIKLGDQGLFLPVLMLVGKQLVICITEKTYKDSMSGMFFFFCLWGEKKNTFFTFLSLSPFLFTLSSCFWWLGERKLHMETEDLSFEFFPCAAASAPLPLAFPSCCISICGCQCLCLWCQCHSSCGNQILFYCIALTNMFPAFCSFCCSSRFQNLQRERDGSPHTYTFCKSESSWTSGWIPFPHVGLLVLFLSKVGLHWLSLICIIFVWYKIQGIFTAPSFFFFFS